MTQSLWVGLSLMGVAAYHLVPALLTGKIPSNWPVYPLTIDSKPVKYRITFAVFLAVGAIGAAITIAAFVNPSA